MSYYIVSFSIKSAINGYPIAIEMPKGTEVLSAHYTNGDICISAMENQNPLIDQEIRKFMIMKKGGYSGKKELKHIAAFQIVFGGEVFHVFEVIKDDA